MSNSKLHKWNLGGIESDVKLAHWFGVSVGQLYWLAGFSPRDQPQGLHYRCHWIRKRNGFRLIESPKALLKSVQKKILEEIIPMIPVHDSVHGFCLDRNVKSFVLPHVGKAFCLRMDLAQFFTSIGAGRIFALFARAGYRRPVARLLTGLCTVATSRTTLADTKRQTSGEELHRMYTRPHLPQGAPTSPALANLAAFRFDRRLAGLAKKASAQYTRYADDLLFSGGVDLCRSARRFHTTVGAIAIEERFEIQFRKTRFMKSSQRQMAAGVVINAKPNLARVEYDRLRAILFKCVHNGAESQNLTQHKNFRSHLRGRIEWASQLNPKRREKLMALYAEIDWSA